MNLDRRGYVVAVCLSLVLASSALALDFVQQGVQPVYQFEIFESSGFLPPGSMGDVTLDFQALGTADISIDEGLFEDLGPAINSGAGLFLYGEPGNGKSTLAKRITQCFGQRRPFFLCIARYFFQDFIGAEHVAKVFCLFDR